MAIADYEHVEVDTRAGWRAWLLANHAARAGVWAVWCKKSSGRATVAYEELVEEDDHPLGTQAPSEGAPGTEPAAEGGPAA